MNAQGELTVTRPQRLVFFCALLAWCVALIGFRVQRTGSAEFLFLIWNLFLACIPLLASRVLRAAHERKASDALQLGLFAVWLLFLPNAPYILTDLIHLQPNPTGMFWYDLAVLLSAAGTGLLLGYSSLFDVQKIFEQRFNALCGWSVAVGALLLSGYGVYLGRVWRWNSWDVLVNPRGLFAQIVDCVINPSMHFQTYAFSGMFGIGLVLGYATLYSVSGRRALAAD